MKGIGSLIVIISSSHHVYVERESSFLKHKKQRYTSVAAIELWYIIHSIYDIYVVNCVSWVESESGLGAAEYFRFHFRRCQLQILAM